jgi:hypothetical protein
MRKSHQPLKTCVVLRKQQSFRAPSIPIVNKVNPANTAAQTVPSETDPIIREPAGMNIPHTCPSLLHKSFLWLSTAIAGRGLLYEVPRSHSGTTYSVGPSDEWSARPLSDHTHTHSQETDIHTLGGIRNRKRSKQEIVDPRLRPHDHRNRLFHNQERNLCPEPCGPGCSSLAAYPETAAIKSGTGDQLHWPTGCVVYMCP